MNSIELSGKFRNEGDEQTYIGDQYHVLMYDSSNNKIIIIGIFETFGTYYDYIDDVKKKTRTCIREAFANVTFDIDVTSIINKRKSARGIPTKPTPRYQEDENGNLVYVGSTRGTVSYFMPEGRVVYAYNSENKSLTAKHHYMIGRTRAETEKNLCY